MNSLPHIRALLIKTWIGKHLFRGYRYRIVLFATGSLFINIAYAVYHGFLGITQSSVWFLSMWAYYTILGVMRLAAVLCERKSASEDLMDIQYFVLRMSGTLFLVLGFVLSAIIYISLAQDVATKYDKIPMITISAYIFGKITVLSITAFRHRLDVSPILTVLKDITYAETAASLFTLQRSMIVSFGGMAQAHILDSVTGLFVCLFVIALGITMILKSRKDYRKWPNQVL